MKKILLYILINVILTLNSFSQIKIKFATVAPEGTLWMNAMHKLNNDLIKQTENRVKFIFFPGGIAGDEKDILRKMRYGQIHATGFTGLGMGKILPESRILDLPFFFKNDKQVDKVHNALFDFFSKKFREKNFELISWSEAGWTYLFSNKDISSLKIYKQLKMWAWEGDPIALKTFENLGMNPISLSIADVLSSLETGLLNSVYTPPLAAIAMQWNTKLKYVLMKPLVHSSGALLITTKQFNQLTKTDRDTLKKLSKKHFLELTKQTREENENALKDMIKRGLTPIEPSEALLTLFSKTLVNVKKELTGDLFDKSLIKKADALLNEEPNKT